MEFNMAYLRGLPPNHPGQCLRVGEVPSLDGLRAVSVLLVMVAHSGLQWIVPGGFGVTMFFFISGFIITTLLIREQSKRGTINVSAFYLRRALRLYPALLAFVIAIVAAYTLVNAEPRFTAIAGGLLYFMNYLVIFSPENVLPQSNHLWSLAVEAHFYLVYPLLFLWLGSEWRRFAIVLAVLCAVSLALRIWASLSFPSAALVYEYAYQASETRLDSIAYGALCALLLLSPLGDRVARLLTSRATVVAGLAVLAGTLLIRHPVFRDTVRYTLQGLALMPVITACVLGGPGWIEKARSILNSRTFVLGGALSYSLYLWHPALFALGPKLAGAEGAGIVLGWILALIVAAISYYGIEQPMLSVRSRFGSERGQSSPDAAPAQTSPPYGTEPKGTPHLYVVGEDHVAGEMHAPRSLLRSPTQPHSNRRILP